MSKPATAKPSAEADETPDELRARLLQLAEDYVAAFFLNPTEENLQTAQLLRGIGESADLRRKLHSEWTSLLNKAHGFGHAWQRWYWIDLIPVATEGRDGDAEAVAQDLIVYMPVTLRAECPGYPTNKTEHEEAVAAVVSARNFAPELAMWRACGDLDSLKVARAVLRGLGVTKNDAKSLLRKGQWEAWVREHGATYAVQKVPA